MNQPTTVELVQALKATGVLPAADKVTDSFIDYLWKLYNSGSQAAIKVPTFMTVEEAVRLGKAVRDFRTHWEFLNKIMPEVQLADNVPANARQVGGDHYKALGVEPWAAMEAWLSREEFIGFLRGNIIKYHARANSGKEDREVQLKKAGHYQQKLEEVLSAPVAHKG